MSSGRAIMNAGLDAAIAIIRDHRSDGRAVLIQKLSVNPDVQRLVKQAGTALKPEGMLIILRHRHSTINRTESLALDAWMTAANKASTEEAIGDAMRLIRKGQQQPCTSIAR